MQAQCAEAEAWLELDDPQRAVEVLTGVERDLDLDAGTVARAIEARIEAFRRLEQPHHVALELDRLLRTAPARAPRLFDALFTSRYEALDLLLEDGDDDTAAVRAEAELVPLAERVIAELERDQIEPGARSRLIWHVAESLRRAGRFSPALTWYGHLDAREQDTADVQFGRAECLFGLRDRDAEAIVIYKQLTASGPDVGRVAYWQSHLRTLQILDRVDRSTDQIVPRIRQLRLQDPTLGGRRFERAFLMLERRHGG